MSPVVALGFKGVRKAGENDRDVRLLCHPYRLGEESRIGSVLLYIVALGVGDLGGDLRYLPGRLQSPRDLIGVDVGAAAALEPGLLGKFPNEGDLLSLLRKGEKAVVFQQDHGLR